MSRPGPHRRRTLALTGGLAAAIVGGIGVLSLGSLASCGDAGVGIDPPDDRLFFPTGILLDPRVADESPTPARWLFVTNANSDLVYNASTLVAVDLDAFMSAWQAEDIREAGAEVDADHPCRRNAQTPQLIECTEESFIRDEATVHLGSFTSVIAPWDRQPGDDKVRLFIPVRSDPSIAYVDLKGGLGSGVPTFDCDTGGDGGRDPRRCGRDRRVKYFRGDPDYNTIGREPANVLISKDPALPLAYITHSELPQLTLVRLTGLVDSAIDDDRKPPRPNEPIIVDIKNLFDDQNPLTYGGYGLAERPCDPNDAPAVTFTPESGACGRPLLYASHRKQQFVLRMTVGAVTPEPGQRCVTAEQLEDGVQGGLLCEEQIFGLDRFFAGGFDSGTASGQAVFGDLAFAREGNTLYVVQSNPGALVRVDTSLDERAVTRDTPAGIVEVCANPTAMILFDDAIGDGLGPAAATSEYAAVSCYSASAVFIVDLSAFRVIETLSTGSGPHQMVFDRVRGYLYVANTLDATIGVIDVSPERDSRFTEVARLGLQEPYTG